MKRRELITSLSQELCEALNQFERAYRDLESQKVDELFRIREKVRRLYPDQFPEACCDILAKEILSIPWLNMRIVAGQVTSLSGETKRHMWVYDCDRHVYIDIGADDLEQFKDRNIIVFDESLGKKLGYKRNYFETFSAKKHVKRLDVTNY